MSLITKNYRIELGSGQWDRQGIATMWAGAVAVAEFKPSSLLIIDWLTHPVNESVEVFKGESTAHEVSLFFKMMGLIAGKWSAAE